MGLFGRNPWQAHFRFMANSRSARGRALRLYSSATCSGTVAAAKSFQGRFCSSTVPLGKIDKPSNSQA